MVRVNVPSSSDVYFFMAFNYFDLTAGLTLQNSLRSMRYAQFMRQTPYDLFFMHVWSARCNNSKAMNNNYATPPHKRVYNFIRLESTDNMIAIQAT